MSKILDSTSIYDLLILSETEENTQRLINFIRSSPKLIQTSKCSNKLSSNLFNQLKQTPLHIQSNYQLIHTLLQYNSEKKNLKLIKSKDIYGKTCLHYYKDINSLNLLLPYFKTLNILNELDNDGNTILFHNLNTEDELNLLLHTYKINPLVLNNNDENCFQYQLNINIKNSIIYYINNYFTDKYNEYLLLKDRLHSKRLYKIKIKLRNNKYTKKINKLINYNYEDIIQQDTFYNILKYYTIHVYYLDLKVKRRFYSILPPKESNKYDLIYSTI